MSDRQVSAIEQIRAAIKNEGPTPWYHRKVMARHRKEWPALWDAIDRLLATTGTRGISSSHSNFDGPDVLGSLPDYCYCTLDEVMDGHRHHCSAHKPCGDCMDDEDERSDDEWRSDV